ncbi:helix-turn-helix domain-containing protein [Pedobacter sp. NJ-S-72]
MIAFPKDFLYQSLQDKHFLDNAQIFNSIRDVAKLNFIESELEAIIVHVERMEIELLAPYDEFQALILRNDLFNLLFSLERSFKKLSNREVHYRGYSQDCLYVMNFKKLISQTFRKETTVQYYARELHISERTLQKAVMMVLGKSPKELINEQMILESKRLLIHGSMSVKEVSYELGFKEPSSFTKFFKTRTGIFPTQFKENKPS